MGRAASITRSRNRASPGSGPTSSGGTCSAFGTGAVAGRQVGKDGGGTSRRITPPCSSWTHHPRPSLTMAGGTVFHFVTDGIHAALERATAGGRRPRDVRLGGGVATVRQYLQAGLIDDLHLVVRPVLLGAGEHLFRDIDLPALGYECSKKEVGCGREGRLMCSCPGEPEPGGPSDEALHLAGAAWRLSVTLRSLGVAPAAGLGR